MNRLNWFFLLIVTVLLIPAEKATAKKKTEKCDREIWCEVMYRMAAPDMGRPQQRCHLYGMFRTTDGGTGSLVVTAG